MPKKRVTKLHSDFQAVTILKNGGFKCRKACSVRVSEGYNRVTKKIFKKRLQSGFLTKNGDKGAKNG